MTKHRISMLIAVIAIGVASNVAYADSFVVVGQNPAAATSNFANPGLTATTGYTITTQDDGTSYHTILTAAVPNGNLFANLYFYTGGDPSANQSYIGVEVTNNRAFRLSSSSFTSLAGTGFSQSTTTNALTGAVTIESIIPNSFFLTDPLGLGFNKTAAGSPVLLVLSQSFGYSVVGGNNFPPPTYLGSAVIPSAATPEPATIEYMSLASLGLLGALRRRFKSRNNSKV